MTCENTLDPRRGNDVLIKVSNSFGGVAVTFTDATEKVGAVAHGLSNGDAVAFSSVTGPTTVLANTVYWVINKSNDDFELSSTDPNGDVGSTPVNIDADGTGTSIAVFREIAGLQSASIALGAEEVEITNKNSDSWKELLSNTGTRSATISGSGFSMDDFSHDLLNNIFLNNEIRKFRLYLEGSVGAALDASGDAYYEGCFKITQLTFSGEANNTQNIELSLSSSGAVTRTKVA